MLAQEEGLWFWDFEGNKMFYDVEEQVRFRVKNVKFQKPPSVQELRSRGGEDDLSGTAAKPIAVMQVVHVEQYLTSWHCYTNSLMSSLSIADLQNMSWDAVSPSGSAPECDLCPVTEKATHECAVYVQECLWTVRAGSVVTLGVHSGDIACVLWACQMLCLCAVYLSQQLMVLEHMLRSGCFSSKSSQT